MAEQDVAAQVRAMRSVRDFERLGAKYTLRDLDGDALAALFEVFARENRKKPRRFWTAALLSGALCMVAAKLVEHVFRLPDLGGMAGGFGMAASGVGAAAAATPLHRRLAVLITRLDDTRTVGPLLDALDAHECGTRSALAGALCRLLPRLATEDAARLTPEQRKRLSVALTAGNTDLAAAAVRGLVRMGDTSCYDRVARLAEGKGLAKKHADLWQAAKEAMPKLDAAREKERQAATLLRPADAPADATLLRPAEGAPHGDDAALLRPAEAPAQEVEAHG